MVWHRPPVPSPKHSAQIPVLEWFGSRVVEDVHGLGAPGVGDVKVVADEDIAVEEIGQITSSLPETRCTRDRERCALPYRQEPGPRRRNPVGVDYRG